MKANDTTQPLPGTSGWEPWLLSDAQLLDAAKAAQQHLAQATAAWLAVLAEVERREATTHETCMPTASWLAAGTSHSARAARSEVRLAGQLRATPKVADALAAGRVSVEQATVITQGLAHLPDELDTAQREAVTDHLLHFAKEFNPQELKRLVNRAVEVVAPEVIDAHDKAALDRAERLQQHGRYLKFFNDPDGSLMLNGKFPAAQGELLRRHLSALASQQRTTDAAMGVDTTMPQALADAFVQTITHHARCDRGPIAAGDTTRLIVTVDYDKLREGIASATLTETGQEIPAGQLRHLACDAHVLPMVLDSDSQPLDVGRDSRLFSPAQRTALAHRDQGCAFPGCDRPPIDCEAHHITPWHVGGESTLTNGVLLCPHHHHLAEPNPAQPPHRNWKIELDAHGKPVFTSPVTPTGRRFIRQHHRYRT